MATNFPASLDTLTNPTPTTSMSGSLSHAGQHSDVNDAIEALQAKVGADSSAVTSSLDYKVAQLEAAATGKILQVVSTTKTDTFSASIANGAKSAVPGLTVTITPTDATSNILVQGAVNLCTGLASAGCYVTVYRGATAIGVGAAAGSRQQSTASSAVTTSNFMQDTAAFVIIDSPNTTSSITYSIEVSHNSGSVGTVYVNRTIDDSDNSYSNRTASGITVMEVAA